MLLAALPQIVIATFRNHGGDHQNGIGLGEETNVLFNRSGICRRRSFYDSNVQRMPRQLSLFRDATGRTMTIALTRDSAVSKVNSAYLSRPPFGILPSKWFSMVLRIR